MLEVVYLGYQYGSFEDEKTGRKVRYAHLFAMADFEESGNPDYHTGGYKAEKYRLKDAAVLRNLDLQPLDVVELYFDNRARVTKIVLKDGANAEDWIESKSEVA